MEKKKFEVEVAFIISYMKKSTPYLFFVTNQNQEMDFFRKTIELEGVGFNEGKAKDMIRDFLIQHLLGKGVFVNSQKMMFQKMGKRKYLCKYFINLTEPKVNLKQGDFKDVHKAMNVKNRLSNLARQFLINYVSEKRNLFFEEEGEV
jgi:hypothetical protein